MVAATPRTVRESLYWSYANFAMACVSCKHDEPTYQQTDYIVRNKLYHGLLRGTIRPRSLLIDEREKLATATACCYCGAEGDLTLDHLVSQLKGGSHSADNLVVACRPCNSSKGALDLLEWMAKRGLFPPLYLLRRYLKLAIRYCEEHDLMDLVLRERTPQARSSPTLFDNLEADDSTERLAACPFALRLLPFDFPDPPELVARYWDDPDEDIEPEEPY